MMISVLIAGSYTPICLLVLNRRPVELAYYEEFATKEEAMSREYAIKQLTRRKKEELIKKGHPGMQFGT